MSLLLDTHAFLWFMEGNERINRVFVDRPHRWPARIRAPVARASTPTASRISASAKSLVEVRARLEVIAVAPAVLDLEVRRLEKEARTRRADFPGAARAQRTESHKTLEALLPAPLRFTPVQTKDGRRYEITGAAAVRAFCTIESVPKGIRTPVTALKGPCPGPG